MEEKYQSKAAMYFFFFFTLVCQVEHLNGVGGVFRIVPGHAHPLLGDDHQAGRGGEAK